MNRGSISRAGTWALSQVPAFSFFRRISYGLPRQKDLPRQQETPERHGKPADPPQDVTHRSLVWFLLSRVCVARLQEQSPVSRKEDSPPVSQAQDSPNPQEGTMIYYLIRKNTHPVQFLKRFNSTRLRHTTDSREAWTFDDYEKASKFNKTRGRGLYFLFAERP